MLAPTHDGDATRPDSLTSMPIAPSTAEALPTKLDADRPVYWELDVKLSRPGFDFEERYLIPLYS